MTCVLTGYEQNATQATICNACTPGTAKAIAGNRNIAVCAACPSGKYSNTYASVQCTTCPACSASAVLVKTCAADFSVNTQCACNAGCMSIFKSVIDISTNFPTKYRIHWHWTHMHPVRCKHVQEHCRKLVLSGMQHLRRPCPDCIADLCGRLHQRRHRMRMQCRILPNLYDIAHRLPGVSCWLLQQQHVIHALHLVPF